MELMGIKVKIGLKPNGHALYPDFNDLPCVQMAGIDWSKYVDAFGDGWHYDKVSGHKDDDIDSPYGQQWGMLLVPKDFCDEAVSFFPGICTKMTENEVEIFYNTRAHIYDHDEIMDQTVLQGIKMKQDLGLELTPEQQSAIDPTTNTPGIVRNKHKTWAGHKAKNGITIGKNNGQ